MPRISNAPASVVLLGFGLSGRVFHAPLIDTTPALLLDAIVTSDPERQRQAADAYPSAVIYDNAEQAWASGHDLAVVATPNITHVPYATAALESGLHLVLDKPVAPTAASARALAALAIERDLLLVPFQNRRWDSDFLTAELVAGQGTIGRVHRFESRIERMRVLPKVGWRSSPNPEDMGGMLYDLGAHLVDQALRLMGPVESVFATVRTVRPGSSDDDVSIVLTHTSGSVSYLVASQLGAFEAPRMTLYGTHGGLRMMVGDTQEQVLSSGEQPGSGDWGVEPKDSDAQLRVYSDANERTESRIPLEAGDWPAFYSGVSAALRGEQAPPVLIADVVQNLRVLDAARESALSGTVVSLDPAAGHEPPSTS